MFGFSRRVRLEDIEAHDFVLGVGAWALRGKGSVHVVASEQGYDVRIGSSMLEKLNGDSWSAMPFDMSAGIAGEAVFEGRRFAVRPDAFTILELPGEPWFGLEVELSEHQTSDEPCVLSHVKLALGITRDDRLKEALREAEWIEGTRARDLSEPGFVSAPEVVHRRELPAEHSAIAIAPDLYGVLRDPEQGCLRFTFGRNEYDELLRRWHTARIAVVDEEQPFGISPALRRLTGRVDSYSSLLLLPWLAPELARRCRGTPIFQLFGSGPTWIDSDDDSWQTTLAEESARRAEEYDDPALGPPLVFREGRWLNASTALHASYTADHPDGS
jgi:hypothetical protein